MYLYDTTALPSFTWNKYITVYTWASNPNFIFHSNTGPNIRNKKDNNRADIPNHLDWTSLKAKYKKSWAGKMVHLTLSGSQSENRIRCSRLARSRIQPHYIETLLTFEHFEYAVTVRNSSREWKMSKGTFLKRGELEKVTFQNLSYFTW